MQNDSEQVDRLNRLLPPILGFTSFAIFFWTLNPTVVGGDSGELVNVARVLGVAHPPGYPLYTLLAHLFTWLPAGSSAWAVNLFSAVTSSLTAVVACATASRWAKNAWAGFAAAALFTFSPLAWRYSVVAEVFSLNLLFVALILWVATRYWETRERKYLLLFAASAGLGLSHHHTLLFILAPTALFMVWHAGKNLWTAGLVWKGLGLFALGFLPYAYLPLASAKYETVSWGDVTTWSGFWKHFLRQEYGTFQLASAHIGTQELQLTTALFHYARTALSELLIVGVVMAAWSVYRATRKTNGFTPSTLAAVALAFYLLAFHTLANLDFTNPLLLWTYSRFWLVPNLLVALLFAVGLADGIRRLSFGARAAPVVAVTLAALQIALNYTAEDQSQNHSVRLYGKALLENVAPGGILLTRGDLQSNAARYLQIGEGYRTDVVILDRALMTKPWYKTVVARNYPGVVYPGLFYRPGRRGGFDFAAFVKANEARFRIFSTDFEPVSVYESKDESLNASYVFWPVGFVNEIIAKGRWDFKLRLAESQAALGRLFEAGQIDRRPHSAWETMIFELYWKNHLRLASRLLQLEAEGRLASPPDRTAAAQAAADTLEALIRQQPDLYPVAYKLLGLAYSKHADSGARDRQWRAWSEFVHRAPAGDPDRERIRRLIPTPPNP